VCRRISSCPRGRGRHFGGWGGVEGGLEHAERARTWVPAPLPSAGGGETGCLRALSEKKKKKERQKGLVARGFPGVYLETLFAVS
jgi:hypothetical protein